MLGAIARLPSTPIHAMRLPHILVALTVIAALSGCSSTPPRASVTDPASRAEGVASTRASPGKGRPRDAAARGPAGSYSAATLTGDYAEYAEARALIDRLAHEQGFDRAYLNGVLSRVQRQQWILDLVNRPTPPPAAGPTGSWTRYRAKFLTEDRIGAGARFWREHATDLERAREQYGVPPEYVVAIIGVETHYGANVGRQRVIEALATLAFDYPRRSDFFTSELEAYLVMARDEGFDPFAPVGSYAGAMGLGQFMPSSFQRFAVDFDGDGRRDLWNPVDAVGSVANYFSQHGWRTGEPVAVPAVARGREPQVMKADYTTRYRIDELAGSGVTASVPLDGQGEVSLLRLDAVGGYEYWLGLGNFYVITRYNQSVYYAMAVHQLSEEIRSRYERHRAVVDH